MALVAVIFATRAAEWRFAVLRRCNGWALLWRSPSGRSGGRNISSTVAHALDNASSGGLLQVVNESARTVGKRATRPGCDTDDNMALPPSINVRSASTRGSNEH